MDRLFGNLGLLIFRIEKRPIEKMNKEEMGIEGFCKKKRH